MTSKTVEYILFGACVIIGLLLDYPYGIILVGAAMFAVALKGMYDHFEKSKTDKKND